MRLDVIEDECYFCARKYLSTLSVASKSHVNWLYTRLEYLINKLQKV